jgi:hypothetical protein
MPMTSIQDSVPAGKIDVTPSLHVPKFGVFRARGVEPSGMCDHWIGNFEYISYFDTFDGFHPRVFTPEETAPREFSSMEEIGNYLLANPETVAHFQAGGTEGKVILLMFDEETEAQGLG